MRLLEGLKISIKKGRATHNPPRSVICELSRMYCTRALLFCCAARALMASSGGTTYEKRPTHSR